MIGCTSTNDVSWILWFAGTTLEWYAWGLHVPLMMWHGAGVPMPDSGGSDGMAAKNQTSMLGGDVVVYDGQLYGMANATRQTMSTMSTTTKIMIPWTRAG